MNFAFFSLLLLLSLNKSSGNERAHNNSRYSEQVRDVCSPDEIMAKMVDILLPEDYEEGKDNIKTEITSINEVLESMNRFHEYRLNVSRKMTEFTETMNSRLSETLKTIELPTDCMTSLARIISAAKNGELWAMKCKFQDIY